MLIKISKLRLGTRGFTLFEIVVAASIFIVAVSSASTLFVASVRSQRNIVAEHVLIDNTRFALEHIARQIRLAIRDKTGTCVGIANYTFTQSAPDNLKFIDSKSNCVTYKKTGTQIFVDVDPPNGLGGYINHSDVALTSGNIKINALAFEISGTAAIDLIQPRVTTYIDGEAVVSSQSPVKISLQTTVSARNIDTP